MVQFQVQVLVHLYLVNHLLADHFQKRLCASLFRTDDFFCFSSKIKLLKEMMNHLFLLNNRFIIACLWSTSLLLETLNSSVNVIIYAVFNKKFRILFVEMFCSCFRKKEQLKGPVRTSGRFTLGPILYGPVASPSPSPFASSSAPSSRSSSTEAVRFTF